MKKVKLFNKIAKLGTDMFDKELFELSEDIIDPDAILVRSANLHELEFNKNLIAIARAGVGVNNIPIERCTDNGIVVFNTPGANANAVKELAIAALLLSGRKIVDSINWVKTIDTKENDAATVAEKGKSKFVGPELTGKTLGVFGLGKIGVMVANAAVSLGMNVIGFDPYLTVGSALALSSSFKRVDSKEELFEKSDYLTVHATLTNETRNLINKDTIALMKDGVRIINLARGELINNVDISEALNNDKVASYVTDFASNELLELNPKNVIIMPHLGASTPESEDNSAVMASNELIDFFVSGNIKNSINFPETIKAPCTKTRVCVLHKNVPNIIAQVTRVLSDDNVNIESMISNSKGTNAYTIFETNDEVNDMICTHFDGVDGIYRVFIINI